MGGFGPSCNRGNGGGGGGSSLSLCQLLHPPQLAFAREPERGTGGGGDGRSSRCWSLVLCGDY